MEDRQQSALQHTIFQPVSTGHCDDTTVERISLLIMTILTGDLLPLSSVEGQGLCELMPFVLMEYNPPS